MCTHAYAHTRTRTHAHTLSLSLSQKGLVGISQRWPKGAVPASTAGICFRKRSLGQPDKPGALLGAQGPQVRRVRWKGLEPCRGLVSQHAERTQNASFGLEGIRHCAGLSASNSGISHLKSTFTGSRRSRLLPQKLIPIQAPWLGAARNQAQRPRSRRRGSPFVLFYRLFLSPLFLALCPFIFYFCSVLLKSS